MGQGLFTVCIQTAVEETGLPPEMLHALDRHRRSMLDCGQTTGSRGTVLAGNAVIDAGKKLKADLDAGKTLTDLIGKDYRGEWVCNYTHKLGCDVDSEPKTHLTYGFATQVVDPRRRRQHQEGRRRPRRRQGDQPRRCSKARWKARSTWASATR